MKFNDIGKAIAKQFQAMTATGLYRMNVEKDALWDTYLASFPPGTNPIYKTRTEHDCQCCKSFIRTLGGVVTIVDGKIVTLWDISLPDSPYAFVADAMANLVKKSTIDNVFLHTERSVGTARSLMQLEGGEVQAWEHYFVNLPTEAILSGILIGPKQAETRSTKDVMLRSLKEITLESIDIVLELIAQNSLYRGEEHTFVLTEFRKLKVEFDKKVSSEAELSRGRTKKADLFVWSKMKTVPQAISHIRSTVIGTLLVDLSDGKEIEDAVKLFESKVAPTNYKRPTALVTKAMIQKAQAKVEELGFTSALERRYATIDDITVNNLLFANRDAKKKMNVFDEMTSRVPENLKSLDKVTEVTIEQFITKILPKAESLEVLFENRHAGSLVSLIAPADPTAKNMFKWGNNFSWSYVGELTDSIKERVKRAGGRVDAVDLRCSLSWFNGDDLDLHLIEPNSNEISFRNKISTYSGGQLDVDMNAGGDNSRSAVENIFFADKKRMREGTYTVVVNNFCAREKIDVGFDVEIEFDGVIRSFSYAKAVRHKENIEVAKFRYTHLDGIEFLQSMPSTQTSKIAWGVPTQAFHKVNVVMFSPNYWDEKTVGNKHYFFMLEGCLNEGKARGFFNEFLIEELTPHRKVFEVVGSKMKTDESDRQLSGLGFSSTQRNSILCRVSGSFASTVKVTF